MDNIQRAIIFDGDDTLWGTEILYDEAIEECKQKINHSRLDGEKWKRIQLDVDIKNVPIFGFNIERFSFSCCQAYEMLCSEDGFIPIDELKLEIKRIASSVADKKIIVDPFAENLLHKLKKDDYKLGLLTKGEKLLQKKRIKQSGLEMMFDFISIVPNKSSVEIKSLMKKMDVEAENTWMIGNSIRSDIMPALQIGLKTMWIPNRVWEYEKIHDEFLDPRIIHISTLKEVTSVLMNFDR